MASRLGYAFAVAVLVVVAYGTRWQGDAPHRPRAVMPAAAVAAHAAPALPDLGGAPTPPPGQPRLLRHLAVDARPVMTPLKPQGRRGYAERGPPSAAPTS